MLFSSLFSVSPRLSEKEEYILQFDSDFYKSADKDGQPEDGQDRVWLDSHPLGSCRVVAALVAQKPKARGSESPGRAGPDAFLVQKGETHPMPTCKDGLGCVHILGEHRTPSP